MKLLNLDKVVCLSPHPDDTEFSLAGTALKYYNTTFFINCLTKGGAPGFDSSNEEFERRQEVNEYWRELGVENVQVIHSNCDYLTDKTEPEWINYIEDIFFRKDSFEEGVNTGLMIPTYQDSMFEHRFVSQLGYGLIRSYPISLIEYRTVSTLTEWNPNLIVDITSEYIRKVDSMKAFKSQNNKSFFSDTSLEQFHTDYRMTRRGIRYCEQFKILEKFV